MGTSCDGVSAEEIDEMINTAMSYLVDDGGECVKSARRLIADSIRSDPAAARTLMAPLMTPAVDISTARSPDYPAVGDDVGIGAVGVEEIDVDLVKEELATKTTKKKNRCGSDAF